jgi:pimeloyl-ACP methyl ester carboxylesterase
VTDYAGRLRGRLGARIDERPLLGSAAATVLRFLPAAAPRAAVALWHGGGNDRLWGFWYLIESLLAQDIAVTTAHLPGHGPGDDRFSVGATRVRLDALAAHTAKLAPRVALLGQSMGGAFVLDHVARGGQADAVVAVSAPLSLRLGPAVLGEVAALCGAEARRARTYVSGFEALPAFGPFRRDRFPLRTDGPYVAAFSAALAELTLEARLAACGARAPVLLIHGTHDGIVPFSQAERLRSVLGLGARLLAVPGGRHFNPVLRDEVVGTIAHHVMHATTFTASAG